MDPPKRPRADSADDPAAKRQRDLAYRPNQDGTFNPLPNRSQSVFAPYQHRGAPFGQLLQHPRNPQIKSHMEWFVAMQKAEDAARYKFSWENPKYFVFTDHSYGNDGSSGLAVACMTPEGKTFVLALNLDPILDNNLGEAVAVAQATVIAGHLVRGGLEALTGYARGSWDTPEPWPQAPSRPATATIFTDSKLVVDAIAGRGGLSSSEYKSLFDQVIGFVQAKKARRRRSKQPGAQSGPALDLHTLCDEIARKVRLSRESFISIDGEQFPVDRTKFLFDVAFKASFMAHRNRSQVHSAPFSRDVPLAIPTGPRSTSSSEEIAALRKEMAIARQEVAAVTQTLAAIRQEAEASVRVATTNSVGTQTDDPTRDSVAAIAAATQAAPDQTAPPSPAIPAAAGGQANPPPPEPHGFAARAMNMARSLFPIGHIRR
ncbi:hypothetical protein B0T19DRAFT_404249 [Cercophora scortea]|uniref:Uncharacterized protein n=1 Tax=Cercophora scortea TaxID=314031 RepID=A0AAE0I7B9_9PEZI|nr:hypothetical protein B0T19DRAFT_404249 [Cercophora scortea]